MDKGKIMLEDTDLTEKVIPKLEGYNEDIGKIYSMIKEGNLLHEKEIMRRLKEDNPLKFKYPQIDLSFLQMTNKLKIKTGILGDNSREVSVPKFSVYNFYEVEKWAFSICIPAEIYMAESSKYDGGIEVKINQGLHKNKKIFGKNLAKVFESENLHLTKMCKFLEYGRKVLYLTFDGAKKDLRKYVAQDGNKNIGLHIYSFFNSKIPETTVEKIKNAEVDFNKKDIYIITETKPEEWNVKSIIKSDPLVIGIKNKKEAYLIDHFNTTPLENIVKDNCTSNRTN